MYSHSKKTAIRLTRLRFYCWVLYIGLSPIQRTCLVRLLHIVLFLKFLYTAAGFHKHSLAACKEGMALGANFHMDAFLCRTGHKLVSAVAFYRSLMVLRMNTLSHIFHLFFWSRRYWASSGALRITKILYHRGFIFAIAVPRQNLKSGKPAHTPIYIFGKNKLPNTTAIILFHSFHNLSTVSVDKQCLDSKEQRRRCVNCG